jgi:hypothetical protein
MHLAGMGPIEGLTSVFLKIVWAMALRLRLRSRLEVFLGDAECTAEAGLQGSCRTLVDHLDKIV